MKEKNFDGWNEVKKEVDNQEAKKNILVMEKSIGVMWG